MILHMEEKKQVYLAIDLKSFYASVECSGRKLDPLDTNLVVADESRTDKTICLAVSPTLKALGISGRPRLFEVREIIARVNAERKHRNRGRPFEGSSFSARELKENPRLEVGYVTAVPRMAEYMKYSREIYEIYLRYIAPEDIHVYSIDEVFIDATHYLNLYRMSGHELAVKLIRAVLKETGITATAGIGTNMYLAKVAMDIVAKHIPADRDGVRIAELDEASYRRLLWTHEPLTDFWRIGKGTARRLNENGMYTMGDVARTAVENEDLLFRLFGVSAEFLIDHAFGKESVSIADIKAYVPDHQSVGSGQVLSEPYSHEKGRIIIREMSESLADDLLSRKLLCSLITLYIGYDRSNLSDESVMENYRGDIAADWYGRTVPKAASGSVRLPQADNSSRLIRMAALELYERIADPLLTIRRVNISASELVREEEYQKKPRYRQLDLFSQPQPEEDQEKEKEKRDSDRKAQAAMLEIRNRFGKNAVMKGTSMQEGATGRERNRQIGGHKA